MGLSWLILLVSAHCVLGATEYYESYTGQTITEEEYNERIAANTSFWCTNAIETCNADEGRRLDGSCNNLNNPQRGATHTPTYVLLPKVFTGEDEPRLSTSGNELPLARKVRSRILANGRVPDTKFTQLVPNIMVFMGADLTSGQDTVNYLLWRDCCSNPTDPECTVQEVPEDDPVHRFSGLNCLNMTKPWTFQHVGCPLDTTVPQRILSELPQIDLSNIYGSTLNVSLSARLYENGLLKYDEINGKQWPPTGDTGICNANRADLGETRCHDGPGTAMNGLLGINTFAIWFWRNHNFLAAKLAELNSCWDDETVFQTARDINIATYSQLLYYELFPAIMGKDRMIQDGVLTKDGGFRDNYDETLSPGMSMEFNTALRWIHTIQEGIVKLTEPDGTEVGEYPIVELTFRTGWYAINNHLDLVTQSVFRQPTAGFDQVVDPDVAEIGMGVVFQKALDILTNDLAKNRYFGHAPYVDYVNLCEGTNKTFTSIDDLADHIEPEMIEVLKLVYENVNDIDLQAGLWSEKKVEGGYVPKTFYCISAEYLKRSMVSDRHWYERPNRPNAFSAEQLAEVRKMTIASFMCLHGDTVTEIQPKAFELISEENPLVNCSSITTIDLSAWTDATCSDSTDATTTTTTATTTTASTTTAPTTTTTTTIAEETKQSQRITQKIASFIKNFYNKWFN